MCDSSYIDETGCFIGMLDESRTKANFYVVDYKYDVEAPETKAPQLSTLKSFDDSGSESSHSNRSGRSKKGKGGSQRERDEILRGKS